MNIKAIGMSCAGAVAVALASYWIYYQREDSRLLYERVARMREERKAAAAKKREEQCLQMNDAIDAVRLQGRPDLAEQFHKTPACRRVFAQGCDYKVDLLLELQKIGRDDLFQQVSKVGDDCSDEYDFALRHGMPALRDHMKLLDAAVEKAKENQ